MNNEERKLRIAHFGRYAEGDTDLVKCIFLSLQKMGHIVQEWNTGKHPEWLYDPFKRRSGNGPIYIRLSQIYDKLMRFNPDLIICDAGGYTFSQKDMKMLNGIPVLGITLSDPDVMNTVSTYANNFTWLTTNSLASYEEYKKRGFTNVYHMPLGIDYRFFQNRPTLSKYKADVAIIGHGRKDRYPIAKALCNNFNTKLYGRRWPFAKNRMGPVRGEDWFKAAYSTKMLVNFPRTIKGHTNIKAGVLEGVATGKLLFTEYFEEMKILFEYDKEVIGYSSKEDLIRKIRYYLKHPEEAEIIGQNAKQRCLREHTWEERFNKLFKTLDPSKIQGTTV
jgi:spore maturation protein CgeB